MIYLKRFNEGLQYNELQDFCDSSLAYLLDEGFEVKLVKYYDNGVTLPLKFTIKIHLLKPSGDRKAKFSWDEVVDHYIPFLQLLSRRYDFVQEYVREECKSDVLVEFQLTNRFRPCRIQLDKVIEGKFPLLGSLTTGSQTSLTDEDLEHLLSINLTVKDIK